MKKVKITVASNGYTYRGPVQSENTDYITILDEYTNREVTFSKQHLAIIEVLEADEQ